MLGKIPAAGRGFKGIVSYLLRGQAGKERHRGAAAGRQDATGPKVGNRVLFVSTENLLTNDAEKAARVMRATANHSARCKAPVYHFVISWRREDRPDFATMRAIVDEACADMGLSDLQRIAIGHDDTRHRHVHVVVNRIHPETGKAWNRRQDWVRLEITLARIAARHGFERVAGRHNEPSKFKDAAKKAPDREYQMTRRKGAPPPAMKWSASRVANERAKLAALFEHARSWETLHQSLAAMGYRLEAKGAGLVIRDGNTELKLSLVSKTARLATLEQRLGMPFAPAPHDLPPLERAPDGRADATPSLHPQVSPTASAAAFPSRVDNQDNARNDEPIPTAVPEAADDDDDDDQPRRRGRSR